MHYWSTVNPHWMREVALQIQWGFNVWAGILCDHLIGPFFYDGRLTGDRYIHFLQHELPTLLEVPLQIRITMWYQHDGSPPHSALRVMDHLNDTYPEQWIGWYRPVDWVARSPDLTPLDFFSWGYLKNIVYQEQPMTPQQLRERIILACHDITPAMLQWVRLAMMVRFRTCIRQQDGQFEYLLQPYGGNR
ncbi:uncharacterized protein [Periplaneta americana]|uniref:uncharacterized protein n=1 Tax=Periplaneta americana TaxID=6978 RepID=UPI0037E8FB78